MHTNRNVRVGLPSQAKSSYVTMIHADTIPNLPSHFGTAKSHVHIHVEMNRTSTCHHSSVSSVDNYPIRSARSRRIIASRRTLLLSTSRQLRTHERFLTRQVRLDDTRKHKNTLSGQSFGLRFRFTASPRMCAFPSTRIKGYRCVVTRLSPYMSVVVTPTTTGTYCGYICCVWRVCVISTLKYLLSISANRR